MKTICRSVDKQRCHAPLYQQIAEEQISNSVETLLLLPSSLKREDLRL